MNKQLSAAVGMTLCLLGGSAPAHAFGVRGHQIVCAMAQSLLQQDNSVAGQRAAQRLSQMVSNRHLERANNTPVSFGDACLWADAVRDVEVAGNLDGDHENTESWHYINVQRTATAVSRIDCLVGCLTLGLELHSQMLRDARDLPRTFALLYLVHWIGDVHQPLHVSFADDAGGNFLKLSGIDCPDMHTLWDSCMISRQNKTNVQFVTGLIAALPPTSELQAWRAALPETWANESLALTLAPQTRYCRMQGGSCRRPTLPAGGTLALANDYVTQNFPVLQLRMQKAGVRMAKVLKDLLGT
jgi:S1/P1 Nuclease